MDIEILDYLRRFQEGEFNLVHVGLLYLTGLGSVRLAARILPGRAPLERAGALTLSALAPLAGLVLTSTVYPCVACSPPAGCEIVTVGVPFPQELRERDTAPRPAYGACWWSLTEASTAAAAGNFALGTLGLPLLVILLRPGRAQNDDAPPAPPR